MAIKPYAEAPVDRTMPQPLSGGIGTSGYDQYRQGVSVRTQRELYSGMSPKMFPSWQETPNGEQGSTVFGQPRPFKPNVPYQDLSKFNPVEFVQFAGGFDKSQIYPQILWNASLTDPYQLDGAIEPLTIRNAVTLMLVEGTPPAHRISAELLDGNADERGKTSQVVQVYDYRSPLVVKPFIDYPEYFGQTALTSIPLPGVISMNEQVLRPFVDTTFDYRSVYDSPFYENNIGADMAAAITAMSGSFDTLLRSNQVSATAGFVYDNNPLGTDSLAFGGLKR